MYNFLIYMIKNLCNLFFRINVTRPHSTSHVEKYHIEIIV